MGDGRGIRYSCHQLYLQWWWIARGGSMTKMAGSKFGEDIFVAIWREESVVTWHPKKKYLHFQLSRGT